MVFCFPFSLFCPLTFSVFLCSILSFFIFFGAKIKMYMCVCIHSFILCAILLQTVRSHCVSSICPYDYANFQWKIDDFLPQYFFLFYDSLKNFTTQSFSFFSICLEMTCGKFLVGWLWNIVIGGYVRCVCVCESVFGFLRYSKRHSINVENPIPSSHFIEIIDLKKIVQHRFFTAFLNK